MKAMAIQRSSRAATPPALTTLVVGLVALVLAGPASAKWFATPEFADSETRPKRLLVAPTEAVFFKEKVLLREEMVQEARVLEDGVAAALESFLTERGYEVIMPSIDEINDDPATSELFAAARKRFNSELVNITHKPKGVKYRRHQLGDSSTLLAERYNADAVVYPRMLAEGIGAGRMAMSALFGVGTGYSRMDFGIVDGETGVVTAYYFAVLPGIGFKRLTVKAAETTDQLTTSVLKKYPKPGKNLKIRISEAELQEIEAAPSENEDKVLAELEALLAE